MVVLSYIGYVLLGIGTLFLFLGSIGIYRMPDVYSRMQAGTKATTLGAMAFIMGVGLIQPEWLLKTFIIVAFIAISNPISSHALARATHRLRQYPVTDNNIDAYRNDCGDRDDKRQSGASELSEQVMEGEKS